jgi:hypothetical protein
MTEITSEPKVMTRNEFIEFVKEHREETLFRVSLAGPGPDSGHVVVRIFNDVGETS